MNWDIDYSNINFGTTGTPPAGGVGFYMIFNPKIDYQDL